MMKRMKKLYSRHKKDKTDANNNRRHSLPTWYGQDFDPFRKDDINDDNNNNSNNNKNSDGVDNCIVPKHSSGITSMSQSMYDLSTILENGSNTNDNSNNNNSNQISNNGININNSNNKITSYNKNKTSLSKKLFKKRTKFVADSVTSSLSKGLSKSTSDLVKNRKNTSILPSLTSSQTIETASTKKVNSCTSSRRGSYPSCQVNSSSRRASFSGCQVNSSSRRGSCSSRRGSAPSIEVLRENRLSVISKLDDYIENVKKSVDDDNISYAPNRLCCAQLLRLVYQQREQQHIYNSLHPRRKDSSSPSRGRKHFAMPQSNSSSTISGDETLQQRLLNMGNTLTSSSDIMSLGRNASGSDINSESSSLGGVEYNNKDFASTMSVDGSGSCTSSDVDEHAESSLCGSARNTSSHKRFGHRLYNSKYHTGKENSISFGGVIGNGYVSTSSLYSETFNTSSQDIDIY